MARTYCKILGTRENDYTGNTFGQNISQEMTVFSGGAGLPYIDDVIRSSRAVFQLYGAKTSYSAGCFSSLMRSASGQFFVCYGISQKQSLGRDAQFTQWFVTPREELIGGDAFRQEVLCHNFISEEAVHRSTRPSPEEIFRFTDYTRCEVNQLNERRLRVLMRVAVLLCTGHRVLLVERDASYHVDYFRPVLRELYELIPAGHRYQIDVTTGRNEYDLERLGAAQLIVTDQQMNAPDRQMLRTDMEEGIKLNSGEIRWANLTNAERDRLSEYVGGSNITMQTEFNRLMECMDDEKSFWWELPTYNKKFASLETLFKKHEATPILGMPEINQKFCERIPVLLNKPEVGFEGYYFELNLDQSISPASREWCLDYIQRKLRKFGLSDEEYKRIVTNYSNYTILKRELQTISTALAEQTNQYKGRVNAVSALLQRIKSGVSRVLGVPSASAQEPRETEGPLR